MSSPTLEIIMRYWSEPLPETEGTLDLPFDIESFCRDNDTAMEIRDKHIAELAAENVRLRSFVREDGDNLIKADVLLDKDKRIAELEKLLADCDPQWQHAVSENTRLEAENERLREMLHTERQSIAKRLDRIKRAASHLEDAVYDAAMEGK